MNIVNIEDKDINVADLKRDFALLLEEYWVAINTKNCTPFPNELENNINYCKKLIKKWNVV